MFSGTCLSYERAVDGRTDGRLASVCLSSTGIEVGDRGGAENLCRLEMRGRVRARTMLSQRILSWTIYLNGSVYF